MKEITDWVDNLEELEAKDKVLLRNYILSKKKATNHPDSEDELLDCIAELTEMVSACVDNQPSAVKIVQYCFIESIFLSHLRIVNSVRKMLPLHCLARFFLAASTHKKILPRKFTFAL